MATRRPTTTVTGGNAKSVGNEVVYERRFGPRNQIEAVVPFDSFKTDVGWVNGVGDVAFAFRRTFFSDVARGTIAAAGAETALPTGDAARGLGNGYGIVEPFAMMGQALPHRSFLQVHGGFEFPTDSSKASKEAYLRSALGTTFMALHIAAPAIRFPSGVDPGTDVGLSYPFQLTGAFFGRIPSGEPYSFGLSGRGSGTTFYSAFGIGSLCCALKPGFSSFTFSPSLVPEPGTLLVIATGAAYVIQAARRRRSGFAACIRRRT